MTRRAQQPTPFETALLYLAGLDPDKQPIKVELILEPDTRAGDGYIVRATLDLAAGLEAAIYNNAPPGPCLEGEGRSRSPASALAYALQALADQLLGAS